MPAPTSTLGASVDQGPGRRVRLALRDGGPTDVVLLDGLSPLARQIAELLAGPGGPVDLHLLDRGAPPHPLWGGPHVQPWSAWSHFPASSTTTGAAYLEDQAARVAALMATGADVQLVGAGSLSVKPRRHPPHPRAGTSAGALSSS